MKRLFRSEACAVLGLAAMVLSGMLLVGCGSDSPASPPVSGNSLVLPSGWAWIMEDDEQSGVVFTADGRVFDIHMDGGGTWRIGADGTYGTNGNNVMMFYGSGNSRNGTWEFEITDGGTTLTVVPTENVSYGSTMVFIKTSDVNVKIPIPNPGTGGNLVCGSGQAWVVAEEGMGIVFQADGSIIMLRNSGAIWVIYNNGTYTTNGGKFILTLSNEEGSSSGTFTVTGNNLVMTVEGHSMGFTKVSGISVYDPSTYRHTGGILFTSANQAWVAEFYYEATGIVFKQDGTVQLLEGYSGSNNYEIYSEGIYTQSGYTVSIDTPTEQFNASYSVIDNNTLILTIRYDGDGYNYEETIGFTKKSGLNITATQTAKKPELKKQVSKKAVKRGGWLDAKHQKRLADN